MKNCLIIVSALVLVQTGFARILNVPSEYPTIQAGIDAADNGDTVLVAPGLYLENLEIANKNILLTALPDPDTCHIRGSLEIGPAVDTTCIIKGFLITSYGAFDALIDIIDASPILEANIIGDHWWGNDGGGIRIWNSAGIIRGNIIKNNHAYWRGGGISASGSPIIENNIISGNSAALHDVYVQGGGIYIESGIVRYNLIMNNSAYSGYGAPGGGIFAINEDSCLIYNNTIAKNRSFHLYNDDGEGGGIYLYVRPGNSQFGIWNNIIAYNKSSDGVHADIDDSTWTGWDYNLVFGNDSLDYDGLAPGPHDINADPMFVDTATGDYHLMPGSPCIDAGDPSMPLDPDGTRSDIGAYYFDQAVGIDEPGPSGPYRFALSQNYPNPFNSQTIISYSLEREARVSLLIYSISGQRVRSLAEGESQEAGEHSYIWDGVDSNGGPVSTGIYFYELHVDDPAKTTAGSYKESKAMILIK